MRIVTPSEDTHCLYGVRVNRRKDEVTVHRTPSAEIIRRRLTVSVSSDESVILTIRRFYYIINGKEVNAMTDSEKIVLYIEDESKADEAKALSEKSGIEISGEKGGGLTVVFGRECVSLTGYGLSFAGDYEKMLRRIGGGHLQHELLFRACKTKKENPTAVDAAAGMGEDALILAACGYDVTLYEKNPVIAALLRDTLLRASKNPELCEAVGRMHFIEGDSTVLMKEFEFTPDIVYLDPMFPARQKSGLIGKKLQLIQRLECPCESEQELLNAAKELNPEKIIIKRPLKGAFLAGKKPDYSYKGKAIRYDCLAFPK